MTHEEAKNYGVQAGRAINQHDQARYNNLRDWFRRAVAIESNSAELSKMWELGYKEERESNIRFRNLSARY